jgi:hypothetical protein
MTRWTNRLTCDNDHTQHSCIHLPSHHSANWYAIIIAHSTTLSHTPHLFVGICLGHYTLELIPPLCLHRLHFDRVFGIHLCHCTRVTGLNFGKHTSVVGLQFGHSVSVVRIGLVELRSVRANDQRLVCERVRETRAERIA